MNKRGTTTSTSKQLPKYFATGAFVLIILISIVVIFKVDASKETFKAGISSPGQSMADATGSRLGIPFDYIFGKIPTHIYTWLDNTPGSGANISAVIIMISIWTVFFLAFADIISIFGFFGKGVSWVLAFVLAVIMANVQALKAVTLAGLAFTAIFGTVSVLLSFIWIFVLFVLFMFGSTGWREFIMDRRMEDYRLRVRMGAAKAAAGAEGAAAMADAFNAAKNIT